MTFDVRRRSATKKRSFVQSKMKGEEKKVMTPVDCTADKKDRKEEDDQEKRDTTVVRGCA